MVSQRKPGKWAEKWQEKWEENSMKRERERKGTDSEFSRASRIRNTESWWFETVCGRRRVSAGELRDELVLELGYAVG